MRRDPETLTVVDLLEGRVDLYVADAIQRRTKHGVEAQAQRGMDPAVLAGYLDVRFDAAVSTLLREAAWKV